MALVGAVALLTAALLLLARIFRHGFLSDFLSRTVLVGFLAGVGIQVGIAMLPDMMRLGVSAHRALQQLDELARSSAAVHLPTMILSLAVVAVILLGRRLAPRIPVPLLVVVGAIGASFVGFRGPRIRSHGAGSRRLAVARCPDVSWTTCWRSCRSPRRAL
jgi:MFS superfamily sulfate permease-like transporter